MVIGFGEEETVLSDTQKKWKYLICQSPQKEGGEKEKSDGEGVFLCG